MKLMKRDLIGEIESFVNEGAFFVCDFTNSFHHEVIHLSSPRVCGVLFRSDVFQEFHRDVVSSLHSFTRLHASCPSFHLSPPFPSCRQFRLPSDRRLQPFGFEERIQFFLGYVRLEHGGGE